jgi:hypothetical protein
MIFSYHPRNLLQLATITEISLENHSQIHQHQSLTLSFSRKLLNLSTPSKAISKAIDKLQTLLANHTQIRPIESKRTQSQN